MSSSKRTSFSIGLRTARWLCCVLFLAASTHGATALRAAALEQSAATATQPLTLSRCDLPGVSRGARCGALDVPEDPRRPEGRRLKIAVAVIPAANGSTHTDPIVPLMGGPGEDAISAAAVFVDQFASMLEDRDLLLIDQRGTGRSNALRCSLYDAANPATHLRDLFPLAAVERCASRLRARAGLTRYTYRDFANDLEQVRRALGYGPLNLFAGSYGTRAAQVYLREYPRSVRTAYLGSVVPLDVATPLTMARTAQGMVDATLGACAADDACKAAFPNLEEDFRQVIAQLNAGEVRVTVPGRSEPAPLHRGRVLEWFRSLLYRPSTAATLPWTIHRAHAGDWAPIVEGILSNARALDDALSLGLFFAITCNDDIAYASEDAIVQATRGTYLGDYRVRQQQAACAYWPRAPHSEGDRRPVKSSTPTLFVSGDADAASPLWFTERVTPGFSNRREIVMRGRGHTEWNACVSHQYRILVRDGAVRGLDPSACKPEARPPFRTR